MKLIVFLFTIGLLISGCSSPAYRAPISDITSAKDKNKNTLFTSRSSLSVDKVKKSRATSLGNATSYRVQKGDTLFSIAWKASTNVQTLAKRNNLKPPYTIFAGQKLSLRDHDHNKASAVIKKNEASSQKIYKKSKEVASTKKKVNPPVVLKNTKGYSSSKPEKKVAVKKAADQKVNSWSWPAKGKVTESFSVSQAGMKGISIVNQRGTAIYAAASGQVVYAGSGLQGYGHLIIIKHNYDYLSAYAHNEKLLVHENEMIKKGQKIALMGDSGTDSVKLHFEIRYRGKSVDPLRYLNKR